MKYRISGWISHFKGADFTSKKNQFHWIYGYAKSNLFMLILYTVLGLSGTVVSLLSSLVSRDLVDIITGHQTGALIKTFTMMIAVTLGSSLIGMISSYVSKKVSLYVEHGIKRDVFNRIMETKWEALSSYKSGDLVARFNGDSATVSSGILNMIPNLLIYSFRFVSALLMVIKYDYSFAFFALAGIPVSIIISKESMSRMRKSNMGSLKVNSKMSSFNQETFGNMQTVKAFDMLGMYNRRLKALLDEYTDTAMKYQKVSIINSLVLTVVSMCVTYSAQGWGIYKVWKGDITYGTMMMFLSLSTVLTATVNNLISIIPNSISLFNSAQRIMDITDLPKEDFSQKEEVYEFYKAHSSEGIGVHVRSIDCGYGQAEDVFSDVSLDAFPGEVIALVGPSGEGKTTMLRYFLSIISAREGNGFISAGKSEEEGYALTASVRQLMAYVPQGNTMFSGTIASNMRNVKEDASDEEIIDALKKACAWEFIEKLPEGINSEIQERGGGFSEGQAQRLSIARALLRKSPILLLDEATSALDMKTEKRVLENIMTDDYPRTCIVRTLRPTVLRSCERVYSISENSCRILSEDEVEEMISGF